MDFHCPAVRCERTRARGADVRAAAARDEARPTLRRIRRCECRLDLRGSVLIVPGQAVGACPTRAFGCVVPGAKIRINPIMPKLSQQIDHSCQEAADQDVVVSLHADPRLVERRSRSMLNALQQQMASTPIEPPGRLQTLLNELRWRRQLRRSETGGVTPIRAMVFLFLCWLILIAAVVIVKIEAIGWPR
jgi:hypothetical protein